MKTARLILAIALAVSVTACCSCRKGKKNAKPLTETTWAMVEWEGQPFKADNNYTLVFSKEKGRFGGRGDCNSIMGNYTLSDNGKIKIEIGRFDARHVCESGSGRQIHQRTRRVDSYRIDGDLLMLMHDGEMLMVMQAQDTTMK